MNSRIFLFLFVVSLVFPISITAQSNFDVQEYYQFLQNNQNLSSDELISRYAPRDTYYSETVVDTELSKYAYLDSIQMKYNLTEAELQLLKKHHFMVTERLSFDCFGWALHDIYQKDLPVFVTTDAILQALHASYDQILMDLEKAILKPKLTQLLDALYNTFPQLLSSYQGNPTMHPALADVDLYITMAKSLLADEKIAPHFARPGQVDTLWDAILAEECVDLPLFSERNRHLDFSQFTVRGHYTQQYWEDGKRTTLGSYFKAMMWLGRMDFLLTPPPENPWEQPWTREEIRRMNLGAVLLNELLDLANARSLLNDIDEIIRFMVGESDNLTPTELVDIVASQNIQRADALLDDETYDTFQEALVTTPGSGQKILSDFFLMDPFSTEPGTLPVSFKLMGQRFIVDSYIFCNVVFDRIVYNGRKIWRPMPDPLDAMFVLGNDDALPLLKGELDTYHYATQLAALRYLVDAYDADFWNMSLYNVWLQAIRLLNPPADQANFPFFMQTTAWHQQKLNTQLASWAQLRHDNLLYAKQSYTGSTGCSFPHSFVEPYPDFYRQIANFAHKAHSYFAQFPSEGNWVIERIQNYFPRLKSVMDTLANIAQKEVDRELLSIEEELFLKKMLFVSMMSGAPPFSGWYASIFYTMDDAAKGDYLVADVHTQPTDYFGAIVGRVLHVGVGKINLGVFLAEAPSANYQPMAFVGPVMSYYEKITENFDRLTDERWQALVQGGDLPARPDWVNIYLADETGQAMEKGRELSGEIYTNVGNSAKEVPRRFSLSQNYPNPFNPGTAIVFSLERTEPVTLSVFNLMGEKVATLVDGIKPAGEHRIYWNGRDVQGNLLPSGLYFYRLQTPSRTLTRKMTLIR